MKILKIFSITVNLLFLLIIFLLSSSCGESKEDDKPNIILILADDLGYSDLSCYGQTNFSTPNIDKLAEQGIRFTQHYAGSTVCAPSRCVLMTGKHTGHSFIRGNAQNNDGSGQLPIPETEETFVKYLNRTGYKTGIFGKWGLGNAFTTGDPLKHGFDYFFGYHDQVLAHNSFPEYLIRNTEKLYLNNKVKYLSDTLWHKGLGSYSTYKIDYSNDLIFDEMMKFIDMNKNEKFFAYFPTTIPHDNGEAEIGNRFEVPDNSKFKNREWTEENKCYAALVEHLDGYVGKLVQKLEELGISENTLIIFTSDNGSVPFIDHNSNGIFRGFKRDLYEGGIRVPLIIKWPSKVEAGRISHHVSAFWDLFPTFCEIAGIEDYPQLDGISLLPELLGKRQKVHDYLYWEFHWWNDPMQAVRMGKWKGIRLSPNAEIELYDLVLDRGESKNVSSGNSDIVSEIEKIMTSGRKDNKYFMFN
jgi:arylsulfatase A-like enzyme